MFVFGVFFMSKNARKSLQKAISSSYSILGALALCGFGGYWIDSQRDNDNFWLFIGLFLGVVVGMYELAKYILKK